MNNDVLKTFEILHQRAAQIRQKEGRERKIVIQVGSATCENAAGARDVLDEFRKHVAASGRDDIVLHQTGCTGRCSCEPIVGVFVPGQMPIKYQDVDRQRVHEIFTRHVLGGQPVLNYVLDGPVQGIQRHEVLYCASERCGWEARATCGQALEEKLRRRGISADEIRVAQTSCFGACGANQVGTCSHVLVRPDKTLYRIENDADLDEIIERHLIGGKVVERLAVPGKTVGRKFFEIYGDVAFFNRQTRVVLRHNGVLDPSSIAEYFHYRGFQALATVLSKGDPKWVIDEITRSKLRGRGGGGYPTGQKWAMGAAAEDETRYLICNADEGDPGAFMDRSMLESDPLNVIEGMIIGGFAIGAHQGFFYVRAEYPLAIERIETAIAQCREWGLLGKNILGSGFDFDLEIRLGAGAFVCGEETALIHSIEGERGQPRIRPPYPTERGLWGKPTVINNVETFANVSAVINYGADWFARIGTEKSGGTKVFALAGKVRHTGLVEVPMGTTLREVVFGIGGGVAGGRELKAIQTGGPAGGCIPAKWLDTAIDFDTLTQAGSIMGSGGMIVLDETDCMVDIAQYFMSFSQDESCGKCTPCREGTTRMLEILNRITGGQGTEADLDTLGRLARLVKKSSLCGLGRAAPNPVLSTLEHFREEYLAHVVEKRCPAKKCKALVRYEIDPEKCIGCTACARNCPVECIAGQRKETHVIDQARCIKCGRCFEVCRFDAVKRT
ncbi:MAG: NADH-quinone oxidoreductase subunit NuoF [Pirellulales bacterium]|nr:NADH-quinone oxidoreductase subunit NuoF [Pirellulales bacterium]